MNCLKVGGPHLAIRRLVLFFRGGEMLLAKEM